MTYREAITIVARASAAERVAAQHAGDRVLAKVAQWPEHVPELWADLLASMGVVDVVERPEPSVHLPKGPALRQAALRKLWAAQPWTVAELAKATGVSESSLHSYRRTIFRGCTWRSQPRGKYLKAYQLVE